LVYSLNGLQAPPSKGYYKTDFVKEFFDPESSFARIGGGSLGGKARGLGFVNTLIK